MHIRSVLYRKACVVVSVYYRNDMHTPIESAENVAACETMETQTRPHHQGWWTTTCAGSREMATREKKFMREKRAGKRAVFANFR